MNFSFHIKTKTLSFHILGLLCDNLFIIRCFQSRGIGYSKYDGKRRITFRNVSYSGAPEVEEIEIANYITVRSLPWS